MLCALCSMPVSHLRPSAPSADFPEPMLSQVTLWGSGGDSFRNLLSVFFVHSSKFSIGSSQNNAQVTRQQPPGCSAKQYNMKKYYPLLISLLVFVANSFHAQAQEPVIDSYNPVQNASDVPLDVVLELTFNDTIEFNSGTSYLPLKVDNITQGTNVIEVVARNKTIIGDDVSISEDSLSLNIALSSKAPLEVGIVNSGEVCAVGFVFDCSRVDYYCIFGFGGKIAKRNV